MSFGPVVIGTGSGNSGNSLDFSIGSTYGSYARNSLILGLEKWLAGLDNGQDFSGSYRGFAKDAGAGNGTLDSCRVWRRANFV